MTYKSDSETYIYYNNIHTDVYSSCDLMDILDCVENDFRDCYTPEDRRKLLEAIKVIHISKQGVITDMNISYTPPVEGKIKITKPSTNNKKVAPKNASTSKSKK